MSVSNDKDQEMSSIAVTREDSEAQFDPTISAQEANQVQAEEQVFTSANPTSTSTNIDNPSQEIEMDSNSRPASRAQEAHVVPSDSEEDETEQENVLDDSDQFASNVNEVLGKPRSQAGYGVGYSGRSSKASHASPSKRKAQKSNRMGGAGGRRFDTGPNGLDDDFGARDEPLLDDWLRQKYLKLGDIFAAPQRSS